MISLIGFSVLFLIILLMLLGRFHPIPLFVIIPTIGAIIAGFSLDDIQNFMTLGMTKVMKTVTLFIFAILYFAIMQDAGMFDPLFSKMKKTAGSSVVRVAIATVIISIVIALDGSGPSVLIIAVPVLLPLYKRLNMSPFLLILLLGAGSGVMNLLPWGGPLALVAGLIDADPTALWISLIPVQIVGMITVFLMAIILGKREQRSGAGLYSEELYLAAKYVAATAESVIPNQVVPRDEELHLEKDDLKRPKLLWFNILLTVITISVLVWGIIPSGLVFMIGFSIAIVVNYPDRKIQVERLREHAVEVFPIATIVLAAGAFLGIIRETKMIEQMAYSLMAFVPDAWGPFIHIIMGVFATPLGMIFDLSAYNLAFLPLVLEIATQYGISPIHTALAMTIGETVGWVVSPVVPAAYLAVSLVSVNLGTHIRYSLPWIWGLTFIMLVSAVLFGVVT